MQNIPRDFDISIKSRANLNETILNVDQLNEISACTDQVNDEFEFILNKINDDLNEASDLSSALKDNPNIISIRNAFVAGEKNTLLSADYSNLEFRILANLCKDESLIKMFNDPNNDVFILIASKWLDLPTSEIDEEKRQNVKKVI